MNKSKGIKVVATGRALPKECLTNSDLEKLVETSDEWIFDRTGIRQRYRCVKGEENTNTLAVNAARKALIKSGIDKNKIGVVVVATSSVEHVFPSTAAMVQKELGLDEKVFCFDLSAACTGFIYGLTVARGLLLDSPKPYALVIGSEQLSRLIDYTDRNTCILFGDGAGAAIIKLDDKDYYHVEYTRGNDEALYIGGIGGGERYLQMNGREVFKFAVKALAQVIEELLEAAHKTIEDIDCVICHQANERIIRSVMRKYAGNEHKFYMNIESYGNTSAASVPIVMSELDENNNLRNKTSLMEGFGAGLTYGSILASI